MHNLIIIIFFIYNVLSFSTRLKENLLRCRVERAISCNLRYCIWFFENTISSPSTINFHISLSIYVSLRERCNGQSSSRHSLSCFSWGGAPGSSMERFDIDTMRKKGKATRAKFHCLSRQLHLCPATYWIERAKAANFSRSPQNKVWTPQTAMLCVFLSKQSKRYSIQLELFFISNDSW